jgi:hypothetical protein
MKNFVIIMLIAAMIAKVLFDGSAAIRIMLLALLVPLFIHTKKLYISKNLLIVLLSIPCLVLVPVNVPNLFIQIFLLFLLFILSSKFSRLFGESQHCLEFFRYLLLITSGLIGFFVSFPDIIPDLFLAISSLETMKENWVKSRYIVPSLAFNNPRILARFLCIILVIYLSILLLQKERTVRITSFDYLVILSAIIAIFLLGRRSIFIISALSTVSFLIIAGRLGLVLSLIFASTLILVWFFENTALGGLISEIIFDLDANQFAHRLYDVFYNRVQFAVQFSDATGFFGGVISNDVRSKSMEVGLEILISDIGLLAFFALPVFFVTCAYKLYKIILERRDFGLFLSFTWLLIFTFFLLQKGQILYSFELITFFLLMPLFLPKFYRGGE